MGWKTNRALATLAIILACSYSKTIAADDASRRAEIKVKAVSLFKNTKNHCHAFHDLVRFSGSKANDTATLLEDLKLILIGSTLLERGSGALYIGNTPGARGDSGFKDYLRDGSPQVEHLMAAIYFAKMAPPGATEIAALYYEGKNASTADVALWALGLDLGQRVSNANYRDKFPSAIEKTICE